jgi:DNA-directed RNA polymerase specialized sigma24 family protein
VVNPSDPTDDDLAARAARRDRAAFDRYDRRLAAWLLRRLPRPDAEDLLQDILFRARRSAGADKGGNDRTWLFQIARSGLADWVGRHGRPAPDHAAAVGHGLGTLEERERELLRARFGGAEGLPAACARLGVETKTGQNLVGPALARLRECADTLVLPTLPEDPAELPGWLDRQVAGPDLGRLIAELSAVHGPTPDAPDLATVLGPDRPAVLATGLGALSEDRLRTVLRHPSLLAELQDAVAEGGGPYWDELFDHPTLARVARRAREGLAAAAVARRPARRYRRPPVYLRPWFVALTTTVVVLGTVILERPPAPQRWGWTAPRALTRGHTGDERLAALAAAAAEWHGRPRQTPAELRRALKEMRDGCTVVLAADHRRLSAADRAWLSDRCVAWGTKLDRHLADLQGGRPADEVRAEADETVEKVVQALRARAER